MLQQSILKQEKNGITSQPEELAVLGKELSKERIVWLSGYFAGKAEANTSLAELFQKLSGEIEHTVQTAKINFPLKPIGEEKITELKQVTILYASQSGNGAGFAKLASEVGEKRGYQVKLHNMADYKVRDLKNEKNLLLIVSTYGEGDPPFAAEELHEFIHSDRAPRLPNLRYSVLALGDKSYFHFCKTGIEFDKRLEELGAKRVFKRVDCDVDFKNFAGAWLSDSLNAFDASYQKIENDINNEDKLQVSDKTFVEKQDKDFPYVAEILKKTRLNGRGSAKETYHVEMLINSSEVKYKPGDCVGIKPVNSEQLVKKVLEALTLTGNEKVQTKSGVQDLKNALKNEYELTTLNTETVRNHLQKTKSEELNRIVDNQVSFKEFIENNDILDLLHQFPANYEASEFINILKPLSARLYSIASSQKAYDDELHVVIEAVRKTGKDRIRHGCCSTFFADFIDVGDKVSFYIKSNEGFRLPLNSSFPVIMVGAGTGIAPFRAFVDERAKSGANGMNWLIFGNTHFATDFLYQTEWQEHLKSGSLNKISLAFSRDQAEKVYVQHKILQNSKEIYEWISNNAYIYVCGDKHNMANFVYKSFIDVIEKEAGLSEDDAHAFMRNLKKRGLYLEDVY
jgi:sulfite reductase (NADPH) flavoprotein alpha-component